MSAEAPSTFTGQALREAPLLDSASDLCEHLARCGRCQATLDRLADDTELRALADAYNLAEPPSSYGPEVVRLMDKLFLPTPSGASVPASVALPSEDSPAPLAPAASPACLMAFGSYQVVGELGRGGMGVVYKAYQANLKRFVALKTVLSWEHARPEEQARFRTEAEAAARLQHPNIVQIHEVSEQDGRPFFAMELLTGGNLAHKLAGMPLPPREAAALLETLARAVQHAHEQGIVHRDLKPANILLQRTNHGTHGRHGKEEREQTPGELVSSSFPCLPCIPWFTPKIADFGLAKLLDAAGGQTRTGAVMGTPAYMAPEQAEGKTKEVGPLADVYALGTVLYEMLTGRPPFQGASDLDTLEQVRKQEPVPPRRLQPKLPRDLETICLKCLEKEPRRRYASAAQLADRLQLFLDGKPIPDRRVSPVERLLRWCRRKPALAAAGGLAIAALLAVSLVSVLFALKTTKDAEAIARERDVARSRMGQLREVANLVLDNQSEIFDIAGATQGRIPLLQRTLANVEQLVSEPDAESWFLVFQATVCRQLGDVLGNAQNPNLGDTEGALEHYFKALEALHRLAPADLATLDNQRSLAHVHGKIGEMYRELGRLALAEEHHVKSLNLLLDLGRENPSQSKVCRDLAIAYQRLADTLRAQGRYEAALDSYREGLAIRERRVREDPNDDDAERELAISLDKLGDLLLALGRIHEAQVLFERGMVIRRPQTTRHPHNGMIRSNLAQSQINFGNLHKARKEGAEALRQYQQSVLILEQLAREDPNTVSRLRDLTACYLLIADLHQTLGQPEAARHSCREAEEVAKKVTERSLNNTLVRRELAATCFKLGKFTSQLAADSNLLTRLRTELGSEARTYYQRAVAILTSFQKDGVQGKSDTRLLEQLVEHLDQCDKLDRELSKE